MGIPLVPESLERPEDDGTWVPHHILDIDNDPEFLFFGDDDNSDFDWTDSESDDSSENDSDFEDSLELQMGLMESFQDRPSLHDWTSQGIPEFSISCIPGHGLHDYLSSLHELIDESLRRLSRCRELLAQYAGRRSHDQLVDEAFTSPRTLNIVRHNEAFAFFRDPPFVCTLVKPRSIQNSLDRFIPSCFPEKEEGLRPIYDKCSCRRVHQKLEEEQRQEFITFEFSFESLFFNRILKWSTFHIKDRHVCTNVAHIHTEIM